LKAVWLLVVIGIGLPSARDVCARQLEALDRALAVLDSVAVAGDSVQLVAAFRGARSAYKRAEWWLAAVDTVVNAPLREGGEEPDDAADSSEMMVRGRVVAGPVGLQAVEAQLFAEDPRYRAPMGRAAIRRAIAAVREARRERWEWSDREVFGAIRDEMARVDALGMADVDATRSRDGVRESGEAIAGVCEVLRVYASVSECDRAADALRGASDSVDRLGYYARYGVPLERAVEKMRVGSDGARRFWKTASVFDSGAFDPSAFAARGAPAATEAEIALGRALFSDPRLGGKSGRACAFCHEPARAFTDGLARAPGAARHAPTLLNVALQSGAFSDLRSATLEDQVAVVVGDAREMGGLSLDSVAVLVGQPAPTIRWALAAYERTLVRLNSRFDRAVRGDTAALTASERRGFTVFMGRGRCGSCHFAPLFNGVTPPEFARAEVEVIGVPMHPDTARAEPDSDLGRWRVTRAPPDLRAFRTPTVRNAAAASPYMHNGVYRTLDQVIDFYDRGGGEGIGARVANQTLARAPLHLSARDKRDLVAFLRSLSDDTRDYTEQ
jgi:cytochrome c peroxidase